MSRNKFNLKDKKTKIIISSTIIVLLLLFLGVGLGLSSMNNTDSKNIASQGQDKIDKNKTDKKDEKNEVANSSSENKDDKKEVIVTPEENKENTETSTSNSSEVASSNNSGSSESSSSSSSGSGNNGGGSSSGSSNGGGTSNTPAHSHSWNPVTDTVWHDEVGHWETVTIKDAWTEEIPIYEEKEVAICNGCGADITSDIDKHMTDNILAGNMACTGWHTDWKQVQVGTDKISHPAVTEDRWVVDKAGWSETVTTGYSCSCGATK